MDELIEFKLLNKLVIKLNRAIEDQLQKKHYIPLTYYEVLSMLANTPEGYMPMNELAESIQLTPSGLTRVIDRMENKKLIERTSCPTDRRVIYVKITQDGKNRLAQAASTVYQVVEDNLLRYLNQQERLNFVVLLNKLQPQGHNS